MSCERSKTWKQQFHCWTRHPKKTLFLLFLLHSTRHSSRIFWREHYACKHLHISGKCVVVVALLPNFHSALLLKVEFRKLAGAVLLLLKVKMYFEHTSKNAHAWVISFHKVKLNKFLLIQVFHFCSSFALVWLYYFLLLHSYFLLRIRARTPSWKMVFVLNGDVLKSCSTLVSPSASLKMEVCLWWWIMEWRVPAFIPLHHKIIHDLQRVLKKQKQYYDMH